MIWNLKTKAPEAFINQFPEYSPLVLQLLFDRNLKTQSQIDEFFNSDYEADLHDPFLMKGVKEAVKVIKQALKKKKKVTVYGDYDADGICSTVILTDTLRKIGFENVETYIPDRSQEGYGLNVRAVKKLADQKRELIITVDCGSSNVQEVKLANKLGLEVVVVDHHQCPAKLPAAKILINPHQPKETYPFKDLAAVGVVFKLAQALLKEFKIDASFEKWFLDLVALATVADCVPLLGENRTFVKYGLVVLAQTQRVGLKALMKAARITDYSLSIIDNGNGQKEHKVDGLSSWTFAFALAPRINVAARLASVNSAYELLVTQSEIEADQIAERLETLNRQRQQTVASIVKEIENRLVGKALPKVILEASADWTTGLVGLVASKIADKYHRPTFIFNLKDQIAKGSSRGIQKFNLVDALNQCSALLIEHGGHPGAAGLMLDAGKLEALHQQLNSIATKQLTDDDLIPRLEIDAELFLDQVNWTSYDQIQNLAPFGKANPEPIFMLKDLEVVGLRIVGNGRQHLKVELFGPLSLDAESMKKVKAIGFGLGQHGENLSIGDRIDVVFELIADQWNGTRDLQLKIIDFKNAALH